MKRLILKAIFILGAACLLIFTPAMKCFSQENGIEKGDIRIIQDDRVDLLVSKHIRINQNQKGIDGFRIQIFFDSGNNSKTKAQSIYEGFKAKYPDMRAYLSFKSPNYKVRVGDFRTQLDAKRFLNEIIDQYPNAWIIADIINLPRAE
jgi:SPOR domain